MESAVTTRVTIKDIDELQKISRQTFTDTYASGNTEENMRSYLQNTFSTERLSAELHDACSEFYFALLGDEVAGYLKLNTGKAQTELTNDNALEIERIYVRKEYQRRRIGKLLCETAIQRCRELHADYVWLGVWEENARAIQFYNKMGFTAFGKHIFVLGTEEQTDIMMKLAVSG